MGCFDQASITLLSSLSLPGDSTLLHSEIANLHGGVSASPMSEMAEDHLLLMNSCIKFKLFV